MVPPFVKYITRSKGNDRINIFKLTPRGETYLYTMENVLVMLYQEKGLRLRVEPQDIDSHREGKGMGDYEGIKVRDTLIAHQIVRIGKYRYI